MIDNLLPPAWADYDLHELRFLLEARMEGHGQYSAERGSVGLPLADDTCRVILRYEGSRITLIKPGKCFDPAEWRDISSEFEQSMRPGATNVGRNIAFSLHRVGGQWRGGASDARIIPVPSDAPSNPYEIGEHPFVLEFKLAASTRPEVMNYRWRREYRRLALLLNVLLVGGISAQSWRSEHIWAVVPATNGDPLKSSWLQRKYFADIGPGYSEQWTSSQYLPIEELPPEEYYKLRGYDGKDLRVPADLDESISSYWRLARIRRDKFDRALYWFNVAYRHWNISGSASFSALVSCIEALTERGDVHTTRCEICGKDVNHDAPGPTKLFRDFLETYAPGLSAKKERDEMYSLRSGILHGSAVMSVDEDILFGYGPPFGAQLDLHGQLWKLTAIAMRNWLQSSSVIAP